MNFKLIKDFCTKNIIVALDAWQKAQKSDLYNFIKAQKTVKIAIVGILAALVFSIIRGGNEKSEPNHLHVPPASPFQKSLSGNGLVEANSRNIKLGSAQSGIITKVCVKANDRVKKGDILFHLDDKIARISVDLKAQELKSAQASLAIAKVGLEEAKDQLDRARQLKKGVLASEEFRRREFAYDKAKAQVDLASANAQEAEQNLKLSKVTLDQLYTASPIDGVVLKVNAVLGEYISAQDTGKDFIVIGNDDPLYIRTQLDENDVSFFKSEAKAVAFFKNKLSDPIPLKLIRFEPYVAPKRNLRGDSQEWVDTRVVEILYEIPKMDGIFIGQQMDVYIEQ